MDKEGEILFYRKFNGTEKVRKFKQSTEGKRYIVSRIEDASTKKVIWKGKVVNEVSPFKKTPKPMLLEASSAKEKYDKLFLEFKETVLIPAQILEYYQ